MLDSADLVAFGATTDPERTKAFYGGILGLQLVSEDDFALVFDANGTALRIVRVEKAVVPPYTTLGWHVPNIVAAATELSRRGISFERFPGMDQDELGIWRHGPAGVAWFKDPEGALLSITGAD